MSCWGSTIAEGNFGKVYTCAVLEFYQMSRHLVLLIYWVTVFLNVLYSQQVPVYSVIITQAWLCLECITIISHHCLFLAVPTTPELVRQTGPVKTTLYVAQSHQPAQASTSVQHVSITYYVLVSKSLPLLWNTWFEMFSLI